MVMIKINVKEFEIIINKAEINVFNSEEKWLVKLNGNLSIVKTCKEDVERELKSMCEIITKTFELARELRKLIPNVGIKQIVKNMLRAGHTKERIINTVISALKKHGITVNESIIAITVSELVDLECKVSKTLNPSFERKFRELIKRKRDVERVIRLLKRENVRKAIEKAKEVLALLT